MFVKSVTDCVTSDWFTTLYRNKYSILYSSNIFNIDILRDFFLTSFLKVCIDLEGPVTTFDKENKNILLSIRQLICK